MSLRASKVRGPFQLDDQGRLCTEAAPFEVGLEGKVGLLICSDGRCQFKEMG